MTALHLVIGGKTIGTLVQDRGGTLRLSVPPLPLTPRVSLGFTASTNPVPPRKARAYIEGLLPESEPVREATARMFGISPRNPFALLSAIGRDCPGAVQFVPEAERDKEFPGDLVPTSAEQIGERLRSLDADPSQPWIALREHWSLGGAQAKFALRREGEFWYEAHGHQATTHILKPGVRGLSSQALIEHVSLRALHHLGLVVADSEFMTFDGMPAIVVARYDRLRSGGELHRVHQEDLCQATSTLPHDKYDVTAHDVVTALRNARASEESVLRFVQAVLANWILHAPDAHAKNYSVFLTDKEVELAPLYDVSTGLGQRIEYPKTAMGIGGEKRFERITGAHVTAFAKNLNLMPDAGLEIATDLATAMPHAFNLAISEIEEHINPASRAQLHRISRELTEYCRHVRAALNTGI